MYSIVLTIKRDMSFNDPTMNFQLQTYISSPASSNASHRLDTQYIAKDYRNPQLSEGYIPRPHQGISETADNTKSFTCFFPTHPSVQSLSCAWLFATPWIAACQVFPALHYFLELAQTHVHWVGDAIQPSHPLLSCSPPAFSLPQDQGLFQWVNSSHHVTKVLELQHQFLQWILKVDFL